MSTTLPSLTRTIDDTFTHTWYEIQKDAVDNILDANVVTAALREKGCFTSQVGGIFITRTIQYGKKETTEIAKGSILPHGEDELETMARWDWKYFATHVQRNAIDDQKNAGKFAIKNLVSTKLKAAKQALQDKLESVMFGAWSATAEAETTKTVLGLNELVPPYDDRENNTFGNIARSNDWWVPKYKEASANPEVNLMSDMKNLFNTCTAHIESPDLIITGQTWFEIYEDFALDMSQLLVKDSGKLVDLGYRVLKFKGADMVWVPDARIQLSSLNQMLMLNTNYIELVFDPKMWFAATEWKPIALQLERVMHILCTCNLIGTQPRRHGRLYAV